MLNATKNSIPSSHQYFFNPKTVGFIIFSQEQKKDTNLIHKFQEKIPQKSDFTAQSQKIY